MLSRLPFILATIWIGACLYILMMVGISILTDSTAQLIVGVAIGGGGMAIYHVTRFFVIVIQGGDNPDDRDS